jgi:O-antigen/teichoic acid export membrane protein
MAQHGASLVLRLGGSLIMTRLLVPEMFGLMAIATIVIAITSMLSDIGLRQAIIQSSRGDSRTLHDTAWTLQIIRGSVIWLICVGVALTLHLAGVAGKLPEGSAFAAADLPMVIAVVALSAVIQGFQSTKVITANRRLDLKQLTYIEILSQFVGLLVMVALAWVTRSIWAIVTGLLSTAALTVMLGHLWLPGNRNRLLWDRPAVRELFDYGRWVLLSSGLAVLSINGDRLLLGVWVDATTLGLYALALNFVLMFEDATSRLFGSVAMPALSEIARESPERFRSQYFRLRLPFDAGLLGAAGLMFAAGSALIELLYDSRYAQAGLILTVISFGIIFARIGMNVSVFLALGVPKNLAYINVTRVISMFVLVPLAHHFFGFQGALWAIAFHRLPVLPVVFWLNRPHKLNNFTFELLVLLFWPGGYLLGLSLLAIFK